MVTLTIPLHRKASNLNREGEHAIVKGVAAFYGWLSGPGLTKLERVNRDIAEQRPMKHSIGATGF